MNDFSELEAELTRLRPAQVSDALFRRIERALLQPEATPTAGIIPRTTISGRNLVVARARPDGGSRPHLARTRIFRATAAAHRSDRRPGNAGDIHTPFADQRLYNPPP